MTDTHPITTVPLENLRRSYPTSELLSRPVLDSSGASIGMIEDLLMQDDHLAFAILAIGDYSGIAGRRVWWPSTTCRWSTRSSSWPGSAPPS
jgi:sporulation protein YlmC with PRC-barrel domain